MSNEELAKKLYDAYCEATGGLAYNGDKLPGSEEFFSDDTKFKQVNAWRVVASVAQISVAMDVTKTKEDGNQGS